MNRAQTRAFTKEMKSKGYSKSQIETILNSFNVEIPEGTKVKLDYDRITTHPDYISNRASSERQVIRYQKFIEDNKDRIMTVEHDKDHANHPHLFTMAEDDSEDNCKFLFSNSDIIKV